MEQHKPSRDVSVDGTKVRVDARTELADLALRLVQADQIPEAMAVLAAVDALDGGAGRRGTSAGRAAKQAGRAPPEARARILAFVSEEGPVSGGIDAVARAAGCKLAPARGVVRELLAEGLIVRKMVGFRAVYALVGDGI